MVKNGCFVNLMLAVAVGVLIFSIVFDTLGVLLN